YLAVDVPPAPTMLSGEAPAVVEGVGCLYCSGIGPAPDARQLQLRLPCWTDPFDSYHFNYPDYSWRLLPHGPRWRSRSCSFYASSDASLLMRSLRAGHLYTAIDGLASPAAFEFTATNIHGTVREGNDLGVGGPVTLRVRSNAPPEFTTTIWKDSSILTTDHHNQDFTFQTSDAPAMYRVEIRAASPDRVAWITSNPIYVRTAEPGADPPARPPATAAAPLFDGR